MTDKQETKILNIIRDLDCWGYGEIQVKWRQGKIVKIAATKEYKPFTSDNECDIISA